MMASGRNPLEAARQLVEREPHNPFAWIMLAETALDAGDAVAGEAAVQRALALSPGHPEALARLGRAQWMQRRFDEAARSLRAAAAAAPSHAGIALWLGHVLEDTGEAEAAAEAYARAHALAPLHPQLAAYRLAWQRKLCDWSDLDALSAQVRAAVHAGTAAVEPFAFLSEDGGPEEQLRCARLRAEPLARSIVPFPPGPTAASEAPVRLGLLSNGFGAHPTGLLTVAMLESLRTVPGVETHLFALNPDDGSSVRARLQVAARQWHDVGGLAHARVASRIRAAGIEVLVDLRGWGGGGMPEVMAMRPAPVQVNWLAYPGTSGASWIDYVIADRFVLPDALAPHFSEQVLRLPRCFQPSDTHRPLPPPPPREACDLPPRGVVFCCFNNSYKLNPRSVGRALAVLQRVPGSVLWLLSGPGRADERLRAFAATRGVAPERLVFMRKQPHPDYLARLRHADLFLDTHPYNAHTTASDALWAGCPVLTCPGDTFAARVAGSLNHHLGLSSLNTADDAAFIESAVELGNAPERLAALKASLGERRRTSGLFDMPGFAADFGVAVRWMAHRHRQGLPPTAHDFG
ncbi:tetratricopeptide repeat protein [Aerolutibacter ruishenii]|uniref:protein O-GlcNAc transferase n=1 Tax=Aerolutibacter ruishenii TaxID=686800 RepID=A0A562M264_9GAMM|nr:putative O-linked N-acetylglucosamine transferase (SPINDLY family) [Lysobacter ruishenii]